MAAKNGGSKALNTDSTQYFYGTDPVDDVIDTTTILSGYDGSKRDYLRGYDGDDTLTGGTNNDVFIFEKTLSSNGVDTITDFHAYVSDLVEQDLIDLSLVFGKTSRITGSNVDNFIRVDSNQLQINLDGIGDDWETWAKFDNNGESAGGGYIADGDLIHIRTATYDGKIAATNDVAFWTLGPTGTDANSGPNLYGDGQPVILSGDIKSLGVTVSNITWTLKNITDGTSFGSSATLQAYYDYVYFTGSAWGVGSVGSPGTEQLILIGSVTVGGTIYFHSETFTAYSS